MYIQGSILSTKWCLNFTFEFIFLRFVLFFSMTYIRLFAGKSLMHLFIFTYRNLPNNN